MLLVLNGTDAADWDDLQNKVRYSSVVFCHKANGMRVQGTALASHLAKSLKRFREHIAVGKATLSTSTVVSPAPVRP